MRKLSVTFYIDESGRFDELRNKIFELSQAMSVEEQVAYYGYSVVSASSMDEAKRIEDIERVVNELSGSDMKQELIAILNGNPDDYDVEKVIEEWME